MTESKVIAPDAAKLEEALQEWIANEIKDAAKQSFELGKFLFGVSSGSIGVFVSVSELTENSWLGQEWAALVFFVGSAAIALVMAMPKVYRLSELRDLVRAHSAFVQHIKDRSIVWLLLWGIALGFAAAGFADRG